MTKLTISLFRFKPPIRTGEARATRKMVSAPIWMKLIAADSATVSKKSFWLKMYMGEDCSLKVMSNCSSESNFDQDLLRIALNPFYSLCFYSIHTFKPSLNFFIWALSSSVSVSTDKTAYRIMDIATKTAEIRKGNKNGCYYSIMKRNESTFSNMGKRSTRKEMRSGSER